MHVKEKIQKYLLRLNVFLLPVWSRINILQMKQINLHEKILNINIVRLMGVSRGSINIIIEPLQTHQLQDTLTVPVKYVRNDNITPFSRIDFTRAFIIIPGTRRSIDKPLRSLLWIKCIKKVTIQIGKWESLKIGTKKTIEWIQRKHTTLLDIVSGSELK